MELEQKLTILVADDQQPLRFGMARIMSQAGYDIMEADSGSECIRIARDSKPALILLDVMLGDMNGKDVCKGLKEDPETSGIPILLVSSTMTDINNQAEGMEFGADGCISKPVHNRELVARVNAILRIKESEKRLSETLDFVNKVLTASPVGIGTFESNGTLVMANKAMTDIIFDSLLDEDGNLPESVTVVESLGLWDLANDVIQTGSEKRREICFPKDSGDDVWLDCYLNRFKSKDDWNILLTVNDITRQKKNEREKELLIEQLKTAIAEVKSLSGLLPICSSCKKIRDDSGYWRQIEAYIREHSDADFTHSICPDCARKLYPDIFKDE